MKHKKLFISLTAVCSVILFIGVFLLVWFAGDSFAGSSGNFSDYTDFEGFREEFEIPGLDDGAVPQGLAACQAKYTVPDNSSDAEGAVKTVLQRYYFISAYMKDGSPSRLYVVGKDTGYVGYVTFKTEDGKDFCGHAGGVAINNISTSTTPSVANSDDYSLWIADGEYVYTAKASSDYIQAKKTIAQEIVEKAGGVPLVVTGEGGETTEIKNNVITFTASFKPYCNASFVYYYDDPRYTDCTYDRLYIGEFYREGSYETDEGHKVLTPSGYENHAFMYEFNVSKESKYGVTTLTSSTSGSIEFTEENQVPKIQKIFSLPEKIQGMAFSGKKGNGTTDGYLILSESYGLDNSNIMMFDYKTLSSSSKKYSAIIGSSFAYTGVKATIKGQEVDYTDPDLLIYFADKGNSSMFVRNYSIPCMSEELCTFVSTTSGTAAAERVYVLFESGSKKYGAFVRKQLKSVYSFIPRLN